MALHEYLVEILRNVLLEKDIELNECLGSSQHGSVYVGTRRDSGEKLAIKVVDKRDFMESPALVAALKRNDSLKIEHNNLCSIKFFADNDKLLIYGTELADSCSEKTGEYLCDSLENRFKQGKRFNRGQARRYVKNCLFSLQELHDRGLAHRNLKPSNVVFVEKKLKLSEACIPWSGSNPFKPNKARILSPGLDADMYAIGKIAFMLFTGTSECEKNLQYPIEWYSDPNWMKVMAFLDKACNEEPEVRFKDIQELSKEFFDCTRFIGSIDDEIKAILKGRKIELRTFCGEGGFGAVYLGYDINLHRKVAVKIIEDRHDVCFERESHGLVAYSSTENMDRTNHIAIHSYDTTESKESFLYTMELATNLQKDDTKGYSPDTLQHRLEQKKPFDIGEIQRVGNQILDGLKAMHSHGLIHNDIKPDNIYFVQKTVKIGDFGTVTHDTELEMGESYSLGFTPEDFRKTFENENAKNALSPRGLRRLGRERDLYAVGKILYMMLANKSDVMQFPDISVLCLQDETQKRLNTFLVLYACAVKRKRRFSTSTAFKKAFNECFKDYHPIEEEEAEEEIDTDFEPDTEPDTDMDSSLELPTDLAAEIANAKQQTTQEGPQQVMDAPPIKSAQEQPVPAAPAVVPAASAEPAAPAVVPSPVVQSKRKKLIWIVNLFFALLVVLLAIQVVYEWWKNKAIREYHNSPVQQNKMK